MICLKDNLPVIQLASGQVIAFESEWLVRSLSQAAARAGYAKWWLAQHVAESVTDYLQDQDSVNVLPVERLTSAVQSVLQVIGYGGNRAPFRSRAAAHPGLARGTGPRGRHGYELAFFDRLSRTIQELCQEKTPASSCSDWSLASSCCARGKSGAAIAKSSARRSSRSPASRPARSLLRTMRFHFPLHDHL